MAIHFGSKYYHYDKDKNLIVYRPIEIINSDDNKVSVWDCNNKIIKQIDLKDFDNLIEVIPDAKLDLMVTSYRDPNKKDVYAWVYRMSSISQGSIEPQIMLRQDVYSKSKNTFNTSNINWVGECITDLTNTTHLPLTKLAEFNSVDFSYNINLYINDTLEDIMKCIPNSVLDEINKILESLSKFNSDTILGYCDNLKDLFIDNGFIGYYRSIFNITQVDFSIEDHEDGSSILTEENQHKLEDLLRKYISNIQIIKYDQDMCLKDLEKIKHVLISDSKEDIYFIAFDVIDDYPILDDDIMKAFGLQTTSKEDIESQLGITL